MLWTFVKNGQQLRCEVAHGDTPDRYRIIIVHPDRTKAVEDIANPAELIDRTVALMQTFHGDGWQIA